MKILIVDDSISIRKVILRALQELGVKKIYEAKDGQEALKLIEKVPGIDLVFVDWEMPVMDGVTFIAKVREVTALKRIKIVMATVKHSKEDVLKALEAGADYFIAKPFSDKTLIPKIQPIIASLKPAEYMEEFIKLIQKEQDTKVSVSDETLYLDFKNKRIAIDVASLIYHGGMHIEEKKEDVSSEAPVKEEYIFLDDV